MKCKYCSYKVHVKDFNDWQIDLRNFIRVHVTESCTFVPDDLKSTLSKQKDSVEEHYYQFKSS
jgi:hypothetical protein